MPDGSLSRLVTSPAERREGVEMPTADPGRRLVDLGGAIDLSGLGPEDRVRRILFSRIPAAGKILLEGLGLVASTAGHVLLTGRALDRFLEDQARLEFEYDGDAHAGVGVDVSVMVGRAAGGHVETFDGTLSLADALATTTEGNLIADLGSIAGSGPRMVQVCFGDRVVGFDEPEDVETDDLGQRFVRQETANGKLTVYEDGRYVYRVVDRQVRSTERFDYGFQDVDGDWFEAALSVDLNGLESGPVSSVSLAADG